MNLAATQVEGVPLSTLYQENPDWVLGTPKLMTLYQQNSK
jgi:hypothetical protein